MIEVVVGDLVCLGICFGDWVMVVGENLIGVIVLMYVVSWFDVWVVMMSVWFGLYELDVIEGDCKFRCVFYMYGILVEVDVVVCWCGVEVELFMGIGVIKVGKLEVSVVFEEVYEDFVCQVVVFIYMMGIIGCLKGVMFSYCNFVYVVGWGKRINMFFFEDVIFCVMLIFYLYGLMLL